MKITLIKFPVFNDRFKFLDPYPKISNLNLQLKGYKKYHTELSNRVESGTWYIEAELNDEKI